MISNLLDLSKADEGQLAPNPTSWDVRALVDEVLGELSVNAQARQVGLRSALQAERIHADRDLIQRVLANLVENAIRYSPREAAVTVTSQHVSDHTELRVIDVGRGIAPELREKVFNAFAQLGSGSERAAASGEPWSGSHVLQGGRRGPPWRPSVGRRWPTRRRVLLEVTEWLLISGCCSRAAQVAAWRSPLTSRSWRSATPTCKRP